MSEEDPDYIPVLNPVSAEAWIQEVKNRIAKGVKVTTQAERTAKEKRRDYDRAYAHAYLNTEGPAHERRYAAEIATTEQRAIAEQAEISFRHAERTAKALDKELMAAMAINSNIRTMYGAAGVGE